MRVNKFVAAATGLSRRAADRLIEQGKVSVDGQTARAGTNVATGDKVVLAGKTLQLPATKTIMLNKPVGFVCSRDGQGSPTIYELLPPDAGELKPVGRLDKDSSGLVLLTNDGELANRLTHPRYQKDKVYEVALDKPLTVTDQRAIEQGIELDDGPSRLQLHIRQNDPQHWQVTIQQGRNRQIRRTFAAKGYDVTRLHRTQFGPYHFNHLASGKHKIVTD